FFYSYALLPFLPSFPTRRSSDLWQCLADDGLDISYETFRKALQRIRKKARISAPLRGKSLELPGLCAQETADGVARDPLANLKRDRKSTRLNSSHDQISYAVFCL